jgi:triosephosphate isomerase
MPARWVIGNWKQNVLRAPAAELASAVAEGLAQMPGSVSVGVAPTYLALDAAVEARGQSALQIFAQDVAAQDAGAFTGEVGPAMLREVRVDGALVGHSERRAMFGDTDPLVGSKLEASLRGGLRTVLCFGESLEARESGDHESVVISQLSAALGDLDSSLMTDALILAYEPVWAIGTGRTASPEQAGEMHGTVRRWLREQRGAAGAGRSILYGGSVKPANARALLAAGDVDGFLVGGASLDPSQFLDIVRAAASP